MQQASIPAAELVCRWHSRTERRFIFDSKRTLHKCTVLTGRGGGCGTRGSRIHRHREPRTQPGFKSWLGHLSLCALRYPVFPLRVSTSPLVRQNSEAQRPSLINFMGFIEAGDAHVEKDFGGWFPSLGRGRDGKVEARLWDLELSHPRCWPHIGVGWASGQGRARKIWGPGPSSVPCR